MRFPVASGAALGEMMRSARKKLGWSQRQVAGQTGMSQQNYARIEQNPGVVGFDTVLMVLGVLGLDVLLDDGRHAVSQRAADSPTGGYAQPVFHAIGATGATGSMDHVVANPKKSGVADPASGKQARPGAARNGSTGGKRTAQPALPPGSIWGDEPPETF